ncbi:MAG: hypothetical protein JNN07_09130 [Verrucomicrobiales bacterium]|nr:hypothetical protein [Verrucomicrobiales bacterium]
MNRQSSMLSLLVRVAFRACLWLCTPGLLLCSLAAERDAASPASPGAASGVATNRGPSAVSVFARVHTIDAAKNSFFASNASSVFMVRCTPTTLAKVGGSVVKAADLTVGADVVIRGRLEADGSVSAAFLANRVPIPAPSMKATVPKDGQKPNPK